MNVDSLSVKQQNLLIDATKHAKIVDLGGYDGGLSLWLVKHGADGALVVDKERAPHRIRHNRIDFKRCYFADLDQERVTKYNLALISWPINQEQTSLSLVHVLKWFDRVVYIGKNDGRATVCGTPTLWWHLTRRHLIAHLDGHSSCILCYSSAPRVLSVNPLVTEEYNGLHAEESVVDARAIARSGISL